MIPTSAIERIQPQWAKGKTSGIFVMREDLNHPLLQGNKFRKLQPVVAKVKEQDLSGIVTFGGAYSNHLYATAAAGSLYKIPTIGIVRGTWANTANKTLKAVQDMGMRLHLINATQYTAGPTHPETQRLLELYPDYLILPEGALSGDSIRSCSAIGCDLKKWIAKNRPNTPVAVWVGIGTGGTAAGMLAGLDANAHVHIVAPTSTGISRDLIAQNLALAQLPDQQNFTIHTDYCFGGFGRRHTELDAFTRSFYAETKILPDPVYTCKVLYALYHQVNAEKFATDLTHIVVHTGGLQGWNDTNRFVIEGIC